MSGSVANTMRTLVEGIDNWVANNKAVAPTKTDPAPKSDKGKFRTSKKLDEKPATKSKVPRHPKNPFREGSGYGLLLDIIADSGSKGIGREDLLKAYCKISGKDERLARFDLAVINSARQDSDKRHRSCADGFTILKEGDNYRVRFP